jgi:hypothetical protein
VKLTGRPDLKYAPGPRAAGLDVGTDGLGLEVCLVKLGGGKAGAAGREQATEVGPMVVGTRNDSTKCSQSGRQLDRGTRLHQAIQH